MVALELQEDLAAELERMFEGKTFKTPKGGWSGLHIFRQNLPMQGASTGEQIRGESLAEEELDEEEPGEETLDEELEDLFPYCVVKLDGGKSEDAQSAHIISTKLIFGIYDDALDASGYRDILNLMEDIRCRFRKNPILNSRYAVQEEISWALPDEDAETYPYFFGALFLNWQTPEYRREDEFS